MRISDHNALSYFSSMQQAKLQLEYLGERGKPWVNRLQAVMKPFRPDDFDDAFLASIEALATDLNELTERDMKPVAKYEKIRPAEVRVLPEAQRAIENLHDATNWLRDHAE
jgi:hypothetical protein